MFLLIDVPRRTARRLAALAFAGLALSAILPIHVAKATILLFDQQRDSATSTSVGPTMSGGSLPRDYGDNVTGATMAVPGGIFTYGEGGEGFTPNVTVDIFSSSATPTDAQVTLWQTGYGDLVNVVFGAGPGIGGSPFLSVLLTGAPGYEVDLYGFDLAGFSNTDYTIAAIEVFAGATTLFSTTNFPVEGNFTGARHSSVEFMSALSAPEILLRLDLSNLASGIQDNIGIDSIRFGQTPPAIPEPGTALLLSCGLALLAARRGSNSLPTGAWQITQQPTDH